MNMAAAKGVTSLAVLCLALTVAGCATDAPPPPAPPPPPAAPPVALVSSVSDAAAVYVDYVNGARSMKTAFTDGEAVQYQLQQGASYEPQQLARGVVAYGAIVAMQEPSFRAALRELAINPDARAQLVARIAADPSYAAALPSADIAARRVILALSSDGQDVFNNGAGVKRAAYDIQRQKWSKQVIADRDDRLNRAKQNSVTLRSVQSDESARLLAAALSGTGLVTRATTGQSTGSYVIQGDGVTFTPATDATADDQSAIEPASAATPSGKTKLAVAATDAAVPASAFASTTNVFDRPDLFNTPYTNAVNRSLAIAAIAILGEGGEGRADLINAMMEDSIGEQCFDMSKLNLYQCLSVSTPYFEDVFCLGQHVLMDTGQCLGKMSSHALSFEPAHVVKTYASAEPYIKPAPVKKPTKKSTKTATGAKKKKN